jgi:hypothetical protein
VLLENWPQVARQFVHVVPKPEAAADLPAAHIGPAREVGAAAQQDEVSATPA